MPGVIAWEGGGGRWMLKLRFDWYITLEIWHENRTTTKTVEQRSIYNVNSPVSYSRPHWGELLQIHQSEAKVGKKCIDESSRNGEALLSCFYYTNSTQKQKNVKKYPNL